jgi:hypothetical protein
MNLERIQATRAGPLRSEWFTPMNHSIPPNSHGRIANREQLEQRRPAQNASATEGGIDRSVGIRLPFPMLQKLIVAGFQVDFRSHARAILELDFPEVESQLEEVLLASTIPIEEIIGSGGGETKGTQRLRNALKERGWQKHIFVVQRTIDGVPREAQSHEVDHIRVFEGGTVALEIEWNNKDPFFDRDLENFKRLHADGAISLGIIITRSAALQDTMKVLVKRFADEKVINSYEDIERIGLHPTPRQRADVKKRVEREKNPIPFRDAWVDNFVSDKFGAATTQAGRSRTARSRPIHAPLYLSDCRPVSSVLARIRQKSKS